jgi:hypothetical protein
LPGWVFGNRYARNLATIAFPDAIKTLPSWAGWVTLIPLALFQALAIGLMLRVGTKGADPLRVAASSDPE